MIDKQVNSKLIDNAEYLDTVMPMFNLLEYGQNSSMTSGSLWRYCLKEYFVGINRDLNNNKTKRQQFR